MISWSIYRCYCGSVFCPSATFSLQPFCAHTAQIYPSNLKISIMFKALWKGSCLGWKCFLCSGLLFISVPVPRSLVKIVKYFLSTYYVSSMTLDAGTYLYIWICLLSLRLAWYGERWQTTLHKYSYHLC